ncbi:MAG TPA: hypothetical protein VMG81_01505 [Thermoplasmata archaeon]|nr:hypothetical protein [Thermoplasmata archaeon]
MSSETGEEFNGSGSSPGDSVAAVWVGLSGVEGGGDGLLQTGYTYDASNPSHGWCASFANSCDYGLWWELVGNQNGTLPSEGPYPYSGDPTLSQGDLVYEEVGLVNYPDQYWTSITDHTHTYQWTNFITIPTTDYFTPEDAQTIVEAPIVPTGPYIAQIPGFSNPIPFEDGYICSAYDCPLGSTIDLSEAYNNSWYDTYWLEQARGVSNTGVSFASNSPDFFGHDSWYPEVTWISSRYDWCYNNPYYAQCSGRGGGCIAQATPILTPNGYVPVQSLRPGEPVQEYNFSSDRLVTGSLVSANSTSVGALIVINHGLLELTPTDQPVFMRNATYVGWIRDPQNLTTADSIYDPVSQSWIQIVNVALVKRSATVYDVITTAENDFVANGALLDVKPG